MERLQGSTDPVLHAALLTIREAARRGAVAGRFEPKSEQRLLQSIVDATVRLFEDEHDVKSVMKWKEIYENIESAVDRCTDVANVIDGVLIENL